MEGEQGESDLLRSSVMCIELRTRAAPVCQYLPNTDAKSKLALSFLASQRVAPWTLLQLSDTLWCP